MILPLPRGDHAPRHRLTDMKGAGDVGLQQPLPGLLRKILERRTMLDAGIVDQDVDRAGLGLDAGHCSLNRVPVGHIEGRDVDGVAGSPQLGRLRIELDGRAGVEHDRSTELGQALGKRPADAARRAGDQGKPAGEVEDRGSHGPALFALPEIADPVEQHRER